MKLCGNLTPLFKGYLSDESPKNMAIRQKIESQALTYEQSAVDTGLSVTLGKKKKKRIERT